MTPPLVFFGAFDRHNFGDLLFPHIAAALLPGRAHVVAGLADRELRPFGGHAVQSLHRMAASAELHGAALLHSGGEILTCTAHQAAVMLLPPRDANATLAYLEQHPGAEPRWLQEMLGTAAPMPYVASRTQVPALGRVVFGAVGGVALQQLPTAWHRAVLARLADADAVGVRDHATHQALAAAGIEALLLPDPAVMVEALFGDMIRARAQAAPVAQARRALPHGYLALQLGAEFADDATLEAVAAQLRLLHRDTGLGAVLFRAGAAPWHDDDDLLQRLARRIEPVGVHRFDSLQVWDLCSLLAHASAYAGSSLHGAVVAAAFGVPVVGLLKPGEPARQGKLAAYAATWRFAGEAGATAVPALAGALSRVLSTHAAQRQEQAADWVRAYRAGFERLAGALLAPPAG